MVSLKRLHFSLYHCVFFPTVMQILAGSLDSYLLTHTKKYMTPTHAIIFEHISKCVFMQDMLKSQCKFVTLLGKYAQQKQVGWEVIFSELGFAGSRAPVGARGQHPRLFLQLVLRLQGASIV